MSIITILKYCILYSISDFESQRKLRLLGLTDEDIKNKKDELLVLLTETPKIEFDKLVAIFKKGNFRSIWN